MRHRLALTISLVVLVALIVAGTGVVLILRAQVQHGAVVQLSKEVETIANQANIANAQILRLIRIAAALDGAKLIPINQTTGMPLFNLPRPLIASIFSPTKILGGYGQSGVFRNFAYAALPIHTGVGSPQSRLNLLVITRAIPPIHTAIIFLAITMLTAILIAIVAAEALTFRLTKPILGVIATTSKIAKGDFEARIPDDPQRFKELDLLIESINTMAQDLAESKDAQSQFLLAISHDLRTPLTSIKGYAEGIIDSAVEPNDGAKTILNQANRLSRLVGDLLDLAKLQANTFSLSIQKIDPKMIADQVARVLGDKARRSQIDFKYLPFSTSSDLEIQGDPDRLIQILTNIGDNAYKSAATRIALTCSIQDNEIRITIADDGPGISETAKEAIFKRPYQAGDTKAREVGSGFGLLIASRLAQNMNGRISYKSPFVENSSGTAMTVAFDRSDLNLDL